MKIINTIRWLYLLAIVCFVAELISLFVDTTACSATIVTIGWISLTMVAAIHLHTRIIEKRQTTQEDT